MIIGAALSVIGWLLTAWLLRREVRRRKGLLNIYVGAKLLLLIAAGGGLSGAAAGRPGLDLGRVGLGLLGILSEPTVSLLLSKAVPVAVQLPGVPVVPSRPCPNLIAEVPLAQAAAAGVLAAIGLPGWVLLVMMVLSLVPMLLLIAARGAVECHLYPAGGPGGRLPSRSTSRCSRSIYGATVAPPTSSACGCRTWTG